MSKNISFILFSFSVFVCIMGCASTKMTSFTDPEYRSTTFNQVLIIANTPDLQWRQEIESRLVKTFSEAGVFALESINLFPPTRTLSDNEKVELLIQNNIDSYLVVSIGETGSQQVYIPQTGSTTNTQGNATINGNTVTYKEKSSTTTYGGYTVSKPWAQFDAKLFDVSNGQNAWVASAFTGGNAYANSNTIINSFCAKTVDQLINDGVIGKKVE